MDNEDAAAATIAAVAAAAAASHQAQEQRQLGQDQDSGKAQSDNERSPEPRPEDVPGSSDSQIQTPSHTNGETVDRNDDATSEDIRRQTEAAAQQAVVAAAAAHRAHQERQQRQQQQQDSNGHQLAEEPSGNPQGEGSQEDSGPSAPEGSQSAQQQASASTSTPAGTSKSSKTRSAPSPNGGQPKRRKINTCLQCKARKVKCDKERPLCGPCRKHGIAEACTWADEDSAHAWPSSDYAQSGQGQQQSSWASSNGLGNSYANGNAQGLGGDPQAMIERIVQLEAQVAQQRAQGGEQNSFYDSNGNSFSGEAGANLESLLSGVNANRSHSGDDAATSASQQLAAWSSSFANVSESERGMAADALAMIAQHHPQNSRSTLTALASGAPNLLSGIRFPFSIRSTPDTLREAVNLLPTDDNIDYLLNHILSPLYMTGACHCASSRLVSIQFARFQQQREAGEVANADVSFLALLFMLLVLATDFADVADILARNVVEKEESIPGLIELWLSTGEALLSMADFTGSPSLNCLMALTAARYFYASQGRLVQHNTTLSIALSLAQALGLHRLGSARDDEARWLARADKKANPSNDVSELTKSLPNEFESPDEEIVRDVLTDDGSRFGAFKLGADWQLPDRSHLVRETGRKLWYHLVTLDWIGRAQTNLVYRVVPGQWNTAFPLNVDEEELPDGTGDNPYHLPPEKPPGHPSDTAIYPYMHDITRVCVDICDSHAWNKKPSYDDVLGFDAKWRRVLDDLPVYLRLDGHSEHLPYVRDQENIRPYLAATRFALLECINHRLIVLHRSFLVKGHHDSRYEPSVKAAVDAARMVIFCRQSVMQSGNPIQKFWHYRLHAFNAAMLLSMHLLELARRGVRDTEETARLRDEIAVALTMIDDNKRTNAFPTGEVDAYSTAKQIIGRLVHAVDAQVSRYAGDDGKENNSAESLEGLYTHAGDTSEDGNLQGSLGTQNAQTSGGGGGSTAASGAAAPFSGGAVAEAQNEAAQISSGLDQLLTALLAKSESAQQKSSNAAAALSPAESSASLDDDSLWRMIDSYARPSFI